MEMVHLRSPIKKLDKLFSISQTEGGRATNVFFLDVMRVCKPKEGMFSTEFYILLTVHPGTTLGK